MRLIDADKIIAFAKKACADEDTCLSASALGCEYCRVDFLIKVMQESILPTVDAVPVVHGHWVEKVRAHYFKCSVCKYPVPYKKAVMVNGKRDYNFCPHCGAKMDEVSE